MMIGILDAKCEFSHKKWGCPAEWAMALAQGKPVLILDLEDESQGAKANNAQIREIMQVRDSGVRRARLARVLQELKYLRLYLVVPNLKNE